DPPPGTPAASVSIRPLPAMPSLHEIDGHTDQIAAVLDAAVPPGQVGGQPEAQFGWATVLRDQMYGTSVRVQILRSGGGMLEAYYVFAQAVDPPCSAAAVAAATAVLPGVDGNCTVVFAGGQAIQVTTGPGAIEAIRFLRGGFVSIVARQGTL